MTLVTLAAAVLAIVPHDPWPVDYVDAIEVNTVLDDDGQRRFTQVLWLEIGGPNAIRDWRFFDRQQMPVGGWSLFEDKGTPRAVHVIHRVPLISETYGDPEVERRKAQPLLWRRRLQNSPE